MSHALSSVWGTSHSRVVVSLNEFCALLSGDFTGKILSPLFFMAFLILFWLPSKQSAQCWQGRQQAGVKKESVSFIRPSLESSP